jgi:hypothetical protein
VSSIAARGEWSLGRVLDLYWHFAEPGDTFLGRILAGLDPSSEEFGVLPPHWKLDDPMSNERIKEGMNLMFATILQRWGNTEVDPTGMLLFCLASVVWNSDFLKQTAAADSEHPFNMIPLLSNPDLLKDLKELVTLEPEGQVKEASGIPPHIQNAKMVRDVLDTCLETLEQVKNMAQTVEDSVKNAYEEKAAENGQLTGERLKQIIEENQKTMRDMINEKLTELKSEIQQRLIGASTQQDNNSEENTVQFADGDVDEEGPEMQGQPQVRYRTYAHSGKYWHVPKNFSFPVGVTLEAGWKLWIQGLPANETVDCIGHRLQAPIRPFRKMKPEMLPEPVKTKYNLQWRPIFSLIEQAPDLEIRETNIDAEHIRSSFNIAKEYLKTRVEYCFQNPEKNPMEWQISYWSKKVAPSSIRKHGTDQDKSHLPPELSHRNKPRQQHGRSKPQAERTRVRRRPSVPTGRLVTARTATRTNETDGELPDLRPQLSERARARGREIDAQTAAETAAAIQEEQTPNTSRTAAGDGTTIHLGPRFPLQDPLLQNQRFSR